jgi:hypothetical protein
MAGLAESTVECLSQLSLSEIPKAWVDEVWQTDFCEVCELPDVLSEVLDGKKYYSEELKCLSKVVEEWSKCEPDSQPLGKFVVGLCISRCFVRGFKCLNIEGWEYYVQMVVALKIISKLYSKHSHDNSPKWSHTCLKTHNLSTRCVRTACFQLLTSLGQIVIIL